MDRSNEDMDRNRMQDSDLGDASSEAAAGRRVDRLAASGQWVLAAVVFLISTTFWSPFSDGRMAVIDPVLYAEGVQAAESLTDDPELGATNANHILYHFALFGLTRGLEGLGVDHPGHHSTQILSGLGTALTVLFLGLIAGPRRRVVGLCCGILLASMRGSFYHACGGETVPLATAFSIWTLHLAARERPNLVHVAFALSLSFLARQDSVFITPAVFVLLVGRVPFWPMFRAFAVAGAVPIVVWYGAFALNDAINSAATFKEFVLGIGNQGTFSFAEIVGLSPLHLLLVAFHNAFVPQFDALRDVPVWLGLVPVVVLSFAAFVLRSRSDGRNLRLLLAFVTLLLARQVFFLWFEPQNWEWHVPMVAAGLAFLARASRGPAISSPRLRATALVSVLVLSVTVFVVHVPRSYDARREVLRTAVDQALAAGGPDARYISLGFKPYYLTLWGGYESVRLTDQHPFTALPVHWAPVAASVLSLARQEGRDIVLLVDVFVRNGQPYTHRALGEEVRLESAPGVVESDELTLLRQDGRVFGLFAHPKR